MGTSKQAALWVLRAQSGDREALELLLEDLQPALRRYLGGVVGRSDADDVLQEVLLQIYRKLRWLRDPEVFRSWAFRIASRAGLRHARRRTRWSAAALDDVAPDEVPSTEQAWDGDRVEELLRTHKIAPGAGAVLLLHFHEGMSLGEVAAILDLPLGTVKSRLAYGLAAFRKRIGNKGGM